MYIKTLLGLLLTHAAERLVFNDLCLQCHLRIGYWAVDDLVGEDCTASVAIQKTEILARHWVDLILPTP